MKIIDLTLPIPRLLGRGNAWETGEVQTVQEKAKDVTRGPYRYTSINYYLNMSGMSGTYLDFPGHIRETDDGTHAGNYPLEKLYRLDATVIHLDRTSGSGAISAEDLAAACPVAIQGGGLILNALGQRRFDEIENQSVYLSRDAVDWIIRTGIHLLVSDVYESRHDPQNVFFELFAKGVSTVCLPVNLHLLDAPRARLTVLPLNVPGVTQLPCRVMAECEQT